jgi:hypothetical protein
MMSKEQYIYLVGETLGEVLEMVRQKNNDYTAGTEDPFSNFRLATLEGVEPEVGLMIRVQDKMQRLRTYISRGELMVEGEGFEDAIHDIIGYMLILKGMMTERGN